MMPQKNIIEMALQRASQPLPSDTPTPPSGQVGDGQEGQGEMGIPGMMGAINDIVKSGKLDPETSQKVMQGLQQLAGMYQKIASSGKNPAEVIGPQVEQLFQFVQQQMAGAGGSGQSQGMAQMANLAGAM